jgi:flavin-dependent dehydrogenase
MYISTILQVVVIGAGPAGCFAANEVARAGIRVTVLEKGSRGKDKACGDAFLPSAIVCLQRFGLNKHHLHKLGGISFDRVNLYGERGVIWKVSYRSERGWLLPRAAVDQAMRDKLGPNATVRYNTRAANVMADGGTLRVLTHGPRGEVEKINCDAVIIATGSCSSISGTLGIDGKPEIGASISSYVPIVRNKAPRFIFSSCYHPGYAWFFPL